MATKPAVLPVWGETNTTAADMVQPTDPQIQTGWPLTTTPPSRQRFNWVLNFLMNAVRYFARAGVSDYDAAETYSIGDLVRGDTGLLQRSLVNANINHTPSTSAAQWGSPLVPTPAADDNTTKAASTAYVLGQLSASVPLMNSTGAAGSSTRMARGDHVHPSDSTKANTSGSYPSLSVGFSTQAGTVPWSGVTSKPTSVVAAGFTDAIHSGNIGSQSVAYATNAGRAYPNRSDGNGVNFFWSGQGGQPNWLWGSNDGFNFYVWNPANFSVNFATSASFATTQALGTSNTSIATTAFANPGSSLGVNGYMVFPNGAILQWGVFTANPNGSTFVSYPVAYQSFSIPIPSGAAQSQNAQDNNPGTISGGTAGFTVYNANDQALSTFWMSIGR